MNETHHIDNLIDLSSDYGVMEGQLVLPTHQSQTSPNDGQSVMECTMPNCLIVATGEGRESLDNNPFDCAQKLASRSDDPFDMIEKEACVKARYSMQPTHEVKVGKLLSLSDNNIIDDVDNCEFDENTSFQENISKPTTDSPTVNISSTIYHTALVNDLDSESPPISMSKKSTPDTCSSAFESDESSANSADGCSAKIQKALEHRKRLLKLSIANSTFNSPLSCRTRQGDSGFSTVFSAAAHFSDYILSTESPLKLVDDDLVSDQPAKIPNSENDFEADLKMLSIPMLRKLPSPVPEETSLTTNEANEILPTPQIVTPSDLSAIREKLQAKRMAACNGQDVVSLIDNLKSLLCESDIVDENKKEQANCLLKKLSTALNTEKTEDNNSGEQENSYANAGLLTQAPQSIVRQGTFDKDLQSPGKDKGEHTDMIPTMSDDTSRTTHSLQSTQSPSPPKEIADVMVKSSATYDGEPVAERENLLLPHVDNISPIKPPNFKHMISSEAISQPDVNDIIEQIGKLLEQHKIATLTNNGDDSSRSNSSANNAQQQSAMCNPTFIVVMQTNSIQPTHENVNSSICADAFEDMTSNLAMRRRSQSLSLHDKVKIVQLPVRSHITPAAPETTISPNIECVPRVGTTSDVKTPMRPTMRRNSFCSATPLTPLTSLNRGASMVNTRRPQNLQVQSRYSLGPSRMQDRETQQQAVVRPIQRTSLNAFKPDLKKRLKQQTTKTSVMASSEPLKAVIPIKKVAPMLTTTIATPEGPVAANSRLISHKVNMETSMHLLTKSGKIATTSTPMPSSRGGDKICEFPSACSTPASGAVKSSGTITRNNPRFSISTPTFKLQQTSTTSSVLKKRPIPELTKSKSPGRARCSLGGMLTSTARDRHPITQSNAAKQTTSRMSMRLVKRSSPCTKSTATNKENKKP
ncbi:PREDICTED: uncharacterized protein LOC108370486 isoform X1 [Rhagoletis zephyria]|uniref:uncharacterized protein LOC108370486 isoform X1 n=2 Tax=Rhagoletis zephyria TaxID=28612 RepID=UPI0008118603|nr:PREDICTED: uncharacterized protein LOC108370486 isoform X1 [Rhagoletis zephyria]